MPSIVRALGAMALALGGHAAALPAQSASATAGEPGTLRVNGVERTFIIYVPSTYQRGKPAPVVLVFHGAGGSGRRMAPHTGFNRLAEREGFVAVYPDGLGRRWNDGRSAAARHDDVGFVKALLDTLHRELSLDSTRVYATGISNGAMFSYRLACDLPGVLAAIAPVAGATPANLTAGCAQTTPVSVLAIQGTADPLLPYAGGGVAGVRGSVLSARESIAFWAKLAGCGEAPAVTEEPDRVRDGTRVQLTAYAGCRDGRGVELHTVQGGGHTWPGGPPVGRSVGRVSREIDATALIWEFFARHSRP
ncbi:MAG TPA: PHB depolymerase family esterase [Gemmatimonadales bacterium]|nr:PHB depolymerase family esterase [Gemmatimonadales bacterium]